MSVGVSQSIVCEIIKSTYKPHNNKLKCNCLKQLQAQYYSCDI
ncbi:protein of unknown function [Streptococcus thermophilus]|nr:protein of unknown function [Streptococcus thermophilus]CAD0124894.1 protein of unknown function [Streptococcus thermophilus]CAD0133396.1 protein of unknown function [Streptococcus thermophilus]